MAGPITINFINYSRTDFKKSNSYTGYQFQHGVSTISQQPTDTLAALGGATTMSMDENALSNVASGWCWIASGWKDDSDMHWGVKIYMPFQAIGIGDRPYYETAYGQGSGADYQKPVDDPSEPYDFPSSVGVKIACRPTSHHTSLVVQVSVSDLD